MSIQRAFYYDMGYWEASGNGWVLYQYLPYLSTEEVSSSSTTQDVNSYHIITSLSYDGTTLSFTSARLQEIAALNFENVYGDTETNDTTALKAVRVPFHNGCYDLYKPVSVSFTAYTNAYISNNTLYTTQETTTFYMRARTWSRGRSSRNFLVRFADVGDPNYAAYPDSSAFTPYWVGNSYYAPMFGAVNCDALYYGLPAGTSVEGWRITGFPTSDHYVPMSSRLQYNDFVMYGNAYAMPFESYLTESYIKSDLTYYNSSSIFPCYNKLVYE